MRRGVTFAAMVDATPRAFVSYARSDAAFVLKLAQQLRAQGCTVWVDQLDIPKGARWDEAVEAALRASACLMVVLSPASVKSQNVLDEVAFALDEQRLVLPILLQPVAVPFRLKRLQYIDFTGEYDAAFDQLVVALDTLAQPPQAHDVPPPAELAAPTASQPQPQPVSQSAPSPQPAPEPAPLPPPAPAPLPPRSPAPPASAMTGATGSTQPRRRPLGLLAAAAAGLMVLAYVLLMREPPREPASPDPTPTAVAPTAPMPQPTPSSGATPAAQPPVAAAPTAEVPAAPAAVAPVASTGLDEQRIRGFVDDYIAALNRVDAEGLLAFYAERVDYFGNPGVGHDFILKDKQAFHRRWPVIENRLASDIAIDRSAADGSVSVSYAVRYRVRSAQRGDEKTGAARDVLVLRLVQGRPLIVAQRQQPLGERAAN